MKLTFGLTAALAGCAAAAQQAAQVYTLSSTPTTSTTTQSVTRSLARLLLLQRLASPGKGPSVNDLPEGSDTEAVVSLMNQFGGEPLQIFGDGSSPSQLVVMLEGLTAQQIEDLGNGFETDAAYTISDPPTSRAHDKLIDIDLYGVGVTTNHKCSISEVANPFAEKCWSGKSTVAKYNVQKNTEVIGELTRLLPGLANLARNGEMETTVLLFPASTDASGADQWSDRPQELRRRQDEQVISAIEDPVESEAPTAPTSENTVFYAPSSKIASCYASEDTCMSKTGNCSGHGSCASKYGDESCYTCKCDVGTHWAGPSCAKKDISTPFWLFAGVTLALVGVLSLAIGMLFSVGEEKLPGVIGAGVSRSK